jgi:CheY-like chemotaxis protein
MTDLSRDITAQVPYLRRFARAVLGDQRAGDALVGEVLRHLLATRAAPSEGARLGLFRTLNDLLDERLGQRGDEAERPEAGPIEDGSILVRRITTLDPIGRRLLLLTTLEGFTLGQAAHVLRLEPGAAAALLETAKRALREQRATRILIIEDEPVIALDIQTTVQRDGHTVVGIAMTRQEAVAIARETRPGLVLADIQLADHSSGLDAVREIMADIDVPVIFITAYPERLLIGDRPEPTFLITKPFDPDTLAVSIAQALATSGQAAA